MMHQSFQRQILGLAGWLAASFLAGGTGPLPHRALASSTYNCRGHHGPRPRGSLVRFGRCSTS